LSLRHSTALTSPPAVALQAPLAQIGRWTLAGVAEMGRMATLLGQACLSLVRPPEAAPPFRPALVQQLATLLAMGLPLVALVHVGMG
jgi:phospholipid/cholesterol/gamma-HCH transport system permease protein